MIDNMIDAFYLLDTGYCQVLEASLMSGGAWRTVNCHALAALLHHTREGWLLWDTGYNGPRLAAATARLPYRLYRWLLPAHTQPEQSAVAQLARFGLVPADIGHVVVSHFHPDHIGGMGDFPHARLVCARAAWEEASGKKGSAALRRGILPGLIPGDFAARARFCDFDDGPVLPGMGKTHDLFGDQSLLIVPLPGHARGQIGLFAPDTLPCGSVFLIADAVYLSRCVRENRPPHPVTNLFMDNRRAAVDTVARLHGFHQQNPEVILLPTHCPEAHARVAEEWGAAEWGAAA